MNVITKYNGASAEVIETKVTNVIEDQLGGIEGVDFIESDSSNGSSRVVVNFTHNDMETAANDSRIYVSCDTKFARGCRISDCLEK